MRTRTGILAASLALALVGSACTDAPRVAVASPDPLPLARNFLVSFEVGSPYLNAEAGRVIERVIENTKTSPPSVTYISVAGHGEKQGPAPYNQRLAEQRVMAIKAKLVQQGFPASRVFVQGRGGNFECPEFVNLVSLAVAPCPEWRQLPQKLRERGPVIVMMF